MTKRELIEEISRLNPTAPPVFLARFNEPDLEEYLSHLQWVFEPPADDKPAEAAVAVAAEPVATEPERPRRTERPTAVLAAPTRMKTEDDIAVAQPVGLATADAQEEVPLPLAQNQMEEQPHTWLF